VCIIFVRLVIIDANHYSRTVLLLSSAGRSYIIYEGTPSGPSSPLCRLSIYFGNSEHEPGGNGTDVCTIIRRLVKPEGGKRDQCIYIYTIYVYLYIYILYRYKLYSIVFYTYCASLYCIYVYIMYTIFRLLFPVMHLKSAKVDFPLRKTFV